MSIQALFQQAFEQHRHGRLHEAETLYRQVLQAAPRHADALHLLGVIALQVGQPAPAAELIAQAVAVAPSANRCSDLGNALLALGRRDEAIASYRQALALQEDFAEAHCNLASALLEGDEIDAAVASGRRAVSLKPALADAHGNLGNALARQGRLDEAVACYAQALRLQPGLAVVRGNLGDALTRLGRDADAAEAYRQALAAGLQTAELHVKLARVCKRLGRADQAVASALQALEIADRAAPRAVFVRTVHDLHFGAPQPAVRAWLQRALDEGWAEPAELLTPVLSLVECEPAVQHALAWLRLAVPGDRLAPPLLDAVTGDPLLLALLPKEPLASVALERLLTRLRRQALDDATVSDDGGLDTTPPFDVALAHQCFLNDYVWACSDDEVLQLATLQSHLDDCAASDATPPPRWLAAWASYAPLSALRGAERWAARTWPPEVEALFRQQVTEPADERRRRAAMPRLTAIEDAVSLRVQDQYEVHPYPRWQQLAPAGEPCDLATRLRRECPVAPAVTVRLDGPPQVLVAGCGTGQHPIQLARQLRDARILAVDLSQASLAYAQRLTDALGLPHITYAQADLLNLGSLEQRFDLIESAGVLHHLADPLAGWRVLTGLLRPGGLMKIALYSELGRREVVAARALIAESRGGQGLPSTLAGIRQCRQVLMHDAQSPRSEGLLRSRDFYSTSACRDLLFHVQEHRFTLPRLKDALDRLGLQFLGFAVDPEVAAAYGREFPDDPTRTDLDHWHAFETARPDTFSRMFQFWVRGAA